MTKVSKNSRREVQRAGERQLEEGPADLTSDWDALHAELSAVVQYLA